MSLNPYESPQPAKELPGLPIEENVLPSLRGPSLGLVLLSGLQFFPLVVAPFIAIAKILSSPRLWFAPWESEDLWIAAVQMLSGLGSIYIFYGALQMRQTKNLTVCRRAAILACIPFLSPSIVLGIPFGIWATVVLFRKSVADEFNRQVATPPQVNRCTPLVAGDMHDL
jgi:hypothetical protein